VERSWPFLARWAFLNFCGGRCTVHPQDGRGQSADLDLSGQVLLGLSGMNCVGQTCFATWPVELIGYTRSSLRDGFCRRGKAGKQKPCKECVGRCVEKLTADEVSYI